MREDIQAVRPLGYVVGSVMDRKFGLKVLTRPLSGMGARYVSLSPDMHQGLSVDLV